MPKTVSIKEILISQSLDLIIIFILYFILLLDFRGEITLVPRFLWFSFLAFFDFSSVYMCTSLIFFRKFRLLSGFGLGKSVSSVSHVLRWCVLELLKVVQFQCMCIGIPYLLQFFVTSGVLSRQCLVSIFSPVLFGRMHSSNLYYFISKKWF